jgi:hypothetical protein
MNAVARCAIDQLPEATPTGPPPALQPLQCIFNPVLKSHPTIERMRAVAKGCVVATGLNYTAVEGCLNGPRGNTLMRAAWQQTEALQPKKTWVPWVTVDGAAINAGEMSEAALLPRKICEVYKGGRR